MKSLRILGCAALAVLLAFAISACQKKDETAMMSDTTQVSQGYGTESPPDQTAPPAQPGAQGATLPPEMSSKPSTKSPSTKSKSGSSSASKTPATYADQRTIEVPTGTMFEVEMVTPVDTRTSNVGDRVEAKLIAPITHDGVVIADAGATVTGEVAEVTRASRSKDKDARASLALDFKSIQTVDGPKPLHATVANAEGKLIAKSTSTRDKLIIGGSTIAGAVIGKVAGKDTKATIIGAVGGAAVGTGAVLMAKGHELSIEEGAKVSLRVDKPIVIVER